MIVSVKIPGLVVGWVIAIAISLFLLGKSRKGSGVIYSPLLQPCRDLALVSTFWYLCRVLCVPETNPYRGGWKLIPFILGLPVALAYCYVVLARREFRSWRRAQPFRRDDWQNATGEIQARLQSLYVELQSIDRHGIIRSQDILSEIAALKRVCEQNLRDRDQRALDDSY